MICQKLCVNSLGKKNTLLKILRIIQYQLTFLKYLALLQTCSCFIFASNSYHMPFVFLSRSNLRLFTFLSSFYSIIFLLHSSQIPFIFPSHFSQIHVIFTSCAFHISLSQSCHDPVTICRVPLTFPTCSYHIPITCLSHANLCLSCSYDIPTTFP